MKVRTYTASDFDKFSHFPSGVLLISSPVCHGKSTHDPSRQRREAASSNMEEESPSLEELKKLKVVELKARLSSLGLHTSGRLVNNSFFLPKIELIEMIFALLVAM